jgi:hypothetical protein
MVFLSPFKKGSYMKKLLVLLGTMGLLSLAYLNVMAQYPQAEPLDDKDLGLCWLFGDDTKDDTKMGEQGSNGISHNNNDEKSEGSSSYFDAESDTDDQANEGSDTDNNESSSSSTTADAASSSSDDDEIMPNAPQASSSSISSSSISSSSISSSSTDQSNIIKEGFCKRLARRIFAPCIAGYVKINKACTKKLSACKTFTCKWGHAIFCTKTGRCLFVLYSLTGYAFAIKLGFCNDHVGFEHSLEEIGAAICKKISELYTAYKNSPPLHHDDL